MIVSKKYLALLRAPGCSAPFDMAEMPNLRRAKAWATGRGRDYSVIIYDVTDGRMPYDDSMIYFRKF